MSYEGWMSAVWLFGQPLEVNMVIETSQFIDDVFWSKKNRAGISHLSTENSELEVIHRLNPLLKYIF
jgi:hypothetical protein